MKLVISSCMLAFILGCNLTSAIVHVVVREKDPVRLTCPRSVEGNVTWSRERDGNKVDILTTGGDKDIKHIHDPDKRYQTEVDKSLYIIKVYYSDSGRYFCNNEAAVDLTVLPSGAEFHHAPEKAEVTLICPPDVGGSEDPTWSTDAGEIQQGGRIQVSTVNNTLTIRDLQPADSGLYYCGGKPAGYLKVIQDERESPREPPQIWMMVLKTAVPSLLFLLLLIIIIMVVYFRRRRFKKQEEEVGPVYEEIQDGYVCLTVKDGSNQNDSYHTIYH